MSKALFHEPTLSVTGLNALLAGIARLRVGVVGDWTLDIDWEVAEDGGVKRARKQCASLGAAGAVALGVVALGAKAEAFGVVGDDLWGREILRQLAEAKVGVAGLASQAAWTTPARVRAKAPDGGLAVTEASDGAVLADDAADRVAAALAAKIAGLNAVIVCERQGEQVVGSRLRAALQGVIVKNAAKLFVVDVTGNVNDWTGAALSLTAQAAVEAIDGKTAASGALSIDAVEKAGAELTGRVGKPVLVARGNHGALVAAGGEAALVPAAQQLGKAPRPVDSQAALTAAATLALAAGWGPIEAAALGNLAASIAASKRDGSAATAAGLVATAEEPDWIYWPDLADDARAARYFEATEIEDVSGAEPPKRLTHAIFDHDGTISTLRQGWEAIMEPVMVHAILGPAYATADQATFQRVVERSRDFIDKTTGIQTLIQMQGLAALVREYGFVAEKDVLDEHGYKKIYNDALMKMVEQRAERLRKGELEPRDYAMKGAIDILHKLKAAGVRLYLASGTDEPDVKAESAAMGYADLFEGRIYGSIGDVTKDAKKMVLDRILKEIGQDAMAGVVTLGDGPVELRETRRRGGFTIGVLSDEVRRHGANMSKRARLVRAGADWIVPDFAQLPKLLELLHVK